MFRRADIRDWEKLYSLICELEGDDLPRDAFRSVLEKQLRDERYYCLLCVRDCVVAGLCNLRFEEQLHHCARVAEIMEMVVSAAFRSQGLGHEMFLEAERLCRERGCVLLETRSGQARTAAHRFYVREGMQSSHFGFMKAL